MKHRDLVKHLESEGCELLRHDGCHYIYHNPVTGRSEPVPRHREINEILAKKNYPEPCWRIVVAPPSHSFLRVEN